jgi:hypothetical protein
MVKLFSKIIALSLLLFLFLPLLHFGYFSVVTPSVLAAEDSGEDVPKNPPDAKKPSECGSNAKFGGMLPNNCLFLEEPIGGRPNVDLFVEHCVRNKDNKGAIVCTTELWGGEALSPDDRGPIQAILTRNPAESDQAQAFVLLYSYLGLVYRYMSGIIVGIVILFIIIGGIQMTTSAGDGGKFDEGKKRITKAITGMILWFLASLILYTINPTFFAF